MMMMMMVVVVVAMMMMTTMMTMMMYEQYKDDRKDDKTKIKLTKLRGPTTNASGIHSYFDNIMTKFMINNRTDA